MSYTGFKNDQVTSNSFFIPWLFRIAIIGLPFYSFAQSEIKFDHLTIEDGLSQNSVYYIFQDSRGFMWFGTEDGLNRYDGYDIKIYKHDPRIPQSLSNNTIRSIYEDHMGILWVGTYNGLNRFDRESETFTRFRHDPSDSLSLIGKNVYAIYEDKTQVLWVGTNEGLNRFDRETASFIHYQYDANNPGSLSNNAVYSIYEDHLGILWFGTYGGGLNQFDRETATFIHFQHDPNDSKSLSHNAVYSIFEDHTRTLWFGTYGGGLNQFDRKTKTFTHYQHDPDNPNSLNGNIVLSIFEDQSKKLWIGTRYGLNQFDRKNKAFIHYKHDASNPNSISNNIIYSIYEDPSGLLWLGTYGGGINKIKQSMAAFSHFQHDPKKVNSLSDNGIRAIFEDQSGIIWIGTIGGGLNRFDPKTKSFTHYLHDPNQPKSLNNNGVRSLYEDKSGLLWVGTIGGLNQFDRNKMSFKHFVYDIDDDQSLSHNFVRCIYEDRFGILWIGTVEGLNQFDKTSQRFIHFKHDPKKPGSLSDNSIFTIHEDQSGLLWIGTNGGLNQFDRKTASFIHYQHDPNNHQSLSDNGVRSIHQNQPGILWVGTSGGLNRFDRINQIFTQYREKDGLPNDVIYGITSDDRGNLWLSTNMGLSKFNPESGVFRNYDFHDGLQSNEFNGGAYCKTKSGEILFGGINGFNLFHPDSIRDNQFVPQLRFTSFKRFNTRDVTGKPIEEKGISEKATITLTHNDNIIIFEFAALNYNNTFKNQYIYQLKGFSDKWMELGTDHKVTFTNLSSGHYTLRIKGSNNDGVWNPVPTELKLNILPPWWLSWWAYLLYALSFFGALYLFYRFQLQRKLEQEEAKRLKEISQLKNRFFTNITHEFRTPLTVVSGMSEQIEAFLDQRAYEKIRQTSAIIKRNSNKQLNLINQLLDLAKLESGKLKIHLVQGDVISYVQFLTESFQSFADSKNIRLTFYKEIEELVMDYDAEKLLAIISNLLTNALKFTPEHGKVILHVNKIEQAKGQSLLIKIKDTGIGIDESALPFIFDRFYQVDASPTRQKQGTGIGLALTKEFVELMNGKITVKSRTGEGTEFVVQLPAVRREDTPLALEEQSSSIKEKTNVFLPVTTQEIKEKDFVSASNNNPLVLIVEDNPDIITYLKTCLEGNYQLAIAKNGQEGIDKAIKDIPDIIISDVMMPIKDGYEVTETLKNDERTSHIPIILLTAKATQADKLSGLKRGADAYLTKPFDKKELLIRLQQLLQLRIKLQAHYRSLSPTTKPETQIEDAFLQKIRQAVEKHLSNPDFDNTHLCREIGMSRSQVYRKLMALTDRSASQMIRSIRLHKAKELLTNNDFTIAEVAYQVGFKDPSYFTRTFIEEFGNTPSATRN